MTQQDRSAASISHTVQTLTQTQEGDIQKDKVSLSHRCTSAKQSSRIELQIKYIIVLTVTESDKEPANGTDWMAIRKDFEKR